MHSCVLWLTVTSVWTRWKYNPLIWAAVVSVPKTLGCSMECPEVHTLIIVSSSAILLNTTRARGNWPMKIGSPHVFGVTAGTVELFADTRFTREVSSFNLHFFVHPGISQITPPGLTTNPYSSFSPLCRPWPLTRLIHTSLRLLRVGGWHRYGQPPNHAWRNDPYLSSGQYKNRRLISKTVQDVLDLKRPGVQTALTQVIVFGDSMEARKNDRRSFPGVE